MRRRGKVPRPPGLQFASSVGDHNNLFNNLCFRHRSRTAQTFPCTKALQPEATQSKATRQKLRRTTRAANQSATCHQFPTLAPIARLPCLAFPSHRNSTLKAHHTAQHGTARYIACPSIKAAGATVILPPLSLPLPLPPPLPPRLHAMAATATAAAASQTLAWLTVQ